MVGLGNGKYEITNKKTREKKVVTADELPKYGLSAPQQDQQTPQPALGGVTNTLSNVGLSAIPLLGSAVSDISSMLGGGDITKDNLFYTTQQKRELSQNPIGNALKSGAGMAGWLLPFTKGVLPVLSGTGLASKAGTASLQGGTSGGLIGASQPESSPGSIGVSAGGGAALGPLVGLQRMGLTKGAVARGTEKIAKKASEKGINTTWTDLVTEIRQEVADKLGHGKDIKQAINELIIPETPAQIGTPTVNPTNLLNLRRQLGAKTNRTALQSLFNPASTKDKVGSIARRVISQNIHSLAPETIAPDQLYSIYSKTGDVPKIIRNAVLAGIGAKFGGSLLTRFIQ